MATTNIQSFSGDVEVASDLTVTSNLTVDTNTLHVDSVAGRVGIGKTNPAFELDVNGTLNATSLYLGGSQLEQSPWSSNNSNAYYTTGAVGIGTDFPKKDLEVNGTLRISDTATGIETDLSTVQIEESITFNQKLQAPDRATNDFFGYTVAMSRNGLYVAVQAQLEDTGAGDGGSVYIFSRSGTTWSYQQTITTPDAQPSDAFGRGLALSSDGSYLAAGARFNDDQGNNTGSAYVYVRSGTSWSYQQKFIPPAAPEARFGEVVSITDDGSYLAVSNWGYSGWYGAVHVYVRSGSTWTQQQILTAPDPAPIGFGASTAISGNGSYLVTASGNGPNYGSAYLFSRSGTTWSLQNKVLQPDRQQNDNFGYCCAISSDGSYAIVGARKEDTGATDAGAAYIYVRSGSSWSYQQKIQAPDKQASDEFGCSVTISSDGTYVAVGARKEDTGATDAGAVYIFTRSGTSWSYDTKFQAPDKQASDYFGEYIGMSGAGDYIIAGAPGEDTGAPGAGAAYIYRRPKYSALSSTNAIRADGTVLSFTGQHICFPEGSMSQGMVVSANKNKYMSLNGPLITGAQAIKSSESLPVVSISNVANDRSIFGVVDRCENGGTTRTQTIGVGQVTHEREFGDNRVIVNSLGEGAVWVANTNGPLESGDYITTSNIAGYGQKQDDDVLHSYTVAKITMDCDFDPKDVPIQVIKKDEDGHNILDEYGRIQWEEVPGQTEKEYRIIYLTTDGSATDQANAVWVAAYVGCTYHCG